MLHALLRRDRAAVLVSLVAVIVLAWGYLILGAGIEMDEMDMGGGQIMLMAPPWTLGYAALIFLMWAIMMVAMMLPSAAPTILLVAALARGRIAPIGRPIHPRLRARLDRLQPRRDRTAMGSRSRQHAV